jgi:hypothetical protein
MDLRRFCWTTGTFLLGWLARHPGAKPYALTLTAQTVNSIRVEF